MLYRTIRSTSRFVAALSLLIVSLTIVKGQVSNLARFESGDQQLTVATRLIASDRAASLEFRNGKISYSFIFGRDQWNPLYDLWKKAVAAQSDAWTHIGAVSSLTIESGVGVYLWMTWGNEGTISYTLSKAEFTRFDNALRQAGSFLSVPFEAKVRAPPREAVERPKSSSGSGFFVTNEGHILTNEHVIEGCVEIRVRTVGGTAATATVLAQNPTDDLAVLKTAILPRRTPSLRFTPAPRTGETVIAYGFPLSGLLSSTGNATTGNISALGGLNDDSRHLQISAPVQPGNSGGPLVDMSGNVIGVVFSKLDALRVARLTEDIPQNINFAIKSSVVANFLDSRGISYSSGQLGKELSPPEVVELTKMFPLKYAVRDRVTGLCDEQILPTNSALNPPAA